MSPPPPYLTLYGLNGACSLAPHILLNHTATPYTYTALTRTPQGLASADRRLSAAAYRALNPKGLVPTLAIASSPSPSSQDENPAATPAAVAITEVPAILTFIAANAPDAAAGQRLLGSGVGAGALTRAKVVEWLAWLAGTLHAQGFGALWRPARFVGAEHAEMFEVVAAKGRELIATAFGMVEERVGERFAVGGDGEEEGDGGVFTVVDVFLYVFFRWGFRLEIDMLAEYPRFAAVMRGVEGMESVRRALEEEGLAPVFDETVSRAKY